MKKLLAGFGRRVLKFPRSAPLSVDAESRNAKGLLKIGVTEIRDAATSCSCWRAANRASLLRPKTGSCYCWAFFACDTEGIVHPRPIVEALCRKGLRAAFPFATQSRGTA
jgi:hypothetical protein